MPAERSGVAELERLTARSWRGLEQEPYGDWLLRAGGGLTGRANSVLVLGEPPDDLDRAVSAVERWYAVRGLAARAQVPEPSAPVDLARSPDDAWLTGYRHRGTPLPPVARDILLNADRPVSASIRLDAEPAPLAAVARGVLVDGWLCVTAVTVDYAASAGAFDERLGFTEHHRYHYRTSVGAGR